MWIYLASSPTYSETHFMNAITSWLVASSMSFILSTLNRALFCIWLKDAFGILPSLASASQATKIQEIGGLFGRLALAILILLIASRRTLLRVFLIPGLVIMPLVFGWAAVTRLSYLEIGMFLAGFLTVAQFSFWGNYLPHAFPVHLRGTGESFAANIGGRLIGTCFAGLTQWLAYCLPISAAAPAKVAYAAAGVAFTVYLVNFVASFWLPEPPGEALAE